MADIQTQINALGPNGGVITLDPIIHPISQTITVNVNNVTIQGSGKNATLIKQNFNGDAILIGNGVSGFNLRDVGFAPSIAVSSGSALHFKGFFADNSVDNVYVASGHTGIFLESIGGESVISRISNFLIENCSNAAVVIGSNAQNAQPVVDTYLLNGNISNCGVGLLLVNCSGVYANSVDIVRCVSSGVTTNPATGGKVVFGFFNQIICDSTTSGSGWTFGSSGGVVNNITCNACWAAANSNGVLVGSNLVNGLNFSNGIIRQNRLHGIVLQSGTNIIIDGNQIFGNGISGSVYNGVEVFPGLNGFTITNNVSGLGGFDVSNPQAYGVNINASPTTGNFIVSFNRCPGNRLGGVANGATGPNAIFQSNLSS